MTAVVDVVVEAGEARAVEQMVCTRGSGKGSGADGVYTGLQLCQGTWRSQSASQPHRGIGSLLQPLRLRFFLEFLCSDAIGTSY